jgi:acetoin:2,6-dichlorophenolindophenol oxidoreductase subunit beta
MPDARVITCVEAIREATEQAMAADERVIVIGEGVPDPKAIFGTTLGLREKYGPGRVMDMPVSENGLTGICIGAALRGLKPIMTHQRVDFSLYALEQIINNAAKWSFMFGDDQPVPLVIRMVIGRGWGQGAQHSQSLQAIFAHIPGLTVVMPALPADAKGLLLASIASGKPVIFIEHRWIHGLSGPVPAAPYEMALGRAVVRRVGTDVTVVASSYMTVEALRAAEVLAGEHVAAEVVDLRTIAPLDVETILASVRKTGRLLVADSGWQSFGVAAEIIASVTEANTELKGPPQRVTLPDMPIPSAPSLAQSHYPTYRDIAERVFGMLGKDSRSLSRVWEIEENVPHDVPDLSFTGPF